MFSGIHRWRGSEMFLKSTGTPRIEGYKENHHMMLLEEMTSTKSSQISPSDFPSSGPAPMPEILCSRLTLLNPNPTYCCKMCQIHGAKKSLPVIHAWNEQVMINSTVDDCDRLQGNRAQPGPSASYSWMWSWAHENTNLSPTNDPEPSTSVRTQLAPTCLNKSIFPSFALCTSHLPSVFLSCLEM